MRTSAVSNARWIAISQVVSIGVQLVSLVWLSRLLTPADYGLVAMALVVTNFANLVRDMGTGLALIQKEDLNEETILTSFWFTVGLGAVLGVLVAGLAPLMVLAFKAPGRLGHAKAAEPRTRQLARLLQGKPSCRSLAVLVAARQLGETCVP